jgi:hypothetical protein
MHYRMNSWHYKIIVILIMAFVVSCVPKKQLSYFNDINEMSEPGTIPDPETYNAFR